MIGAAASSASRRVGRGDGYFQGMTRAANPLAATLSRAIAAQQAGNLAEAETHFRAILSVDKKNFGVLHALGVIQGQRGHFAEAEKSLARAVKINPRSAEAFANLGLVLVKMGQAARAAASYERALAINPDFALALSNFSAVLRQMGRADAALRHAERAIALRPTSADAVNNRGNALFDLQRFEESRAAYDKALELAPNMTEAWFGRARSCAALHQLPDALTAFQKVVALDPHLTAAWCGLADACYDAKRYAEALAAYDKVLALEPDGDMIAARRLHSKMQLCDWSDFERSCTAVVAAIANDRPAALPFDLLAFPLSAQQQLKSIRAYARTRHPAHPSPLWRGEVYAHDRIRIAYLSSDFHDHATAHLMAGVFERHDRSRFETTAFSFGPPDDGEMRRRLTSAFDRFIDVRQSSDETIAALVREMEIDIAVDLKGFTTYARTGVFARRPSPIQAAYLGFPATMGTSYIDYIVADAVVIPPAEQSAYAEKVVYLPYSYQANDARQVTADRIPTRRDCGLPERGFVFCSFNNTFKITPDVFAVWMRILRRVEGSVLWLFEGNADAPENLRREAQAHGVSPDRLVFAPRASHADHLARHALADLFLDTLPCNAHTTASDALWAGLPVLTCAGTTFAGRVAASLLNAIGLSELTVHSLADYEELAVRLAHDRDLLGSFKQRLVENRATHPLFDTARLTRHLECAYSRMVERHRDGKSPEGVAVHPDD
jgi:predicted O-linked N-acetylglucosamine transferase (SPINDLY family)